MTLESLNVAVLALSGGIGWLGATLVARYAERMQLVQAPNHRSSHVKPTPHGGGLGIAVAGLLAVGLVLLAVWGVTAPQPAADCSVRITLLDAATNQPVAGVIRVRNAAGESLSLDALLPRGRGVPEKVAIHDWHVFTEPTVVRLPREEFTITAFSGLETEIAAQSLDLRNRDQADVTLRLRRFHDAHAAGW